MVMQVQMHRMSFPILLQRRAVESCPLVEMKRLQEATRDMDMVCCVNSVSYTHLDVYKRQVADDNMALLFRQYENEIIDFETLLKGMIYKKTSSQYSFHTEKSIKLLRKVGN